MSDRVAFPNEGPELLERQREVLPPWLLLYPAQPMELVEGGRTGVWDSSGKGCLDFSGIVTTASRHLVRKMLGALEAQLEPGIAHVSTPDLIRSQIEPRDRLIGLAPIDSATEGFSVSSNTEATEAALLFASSWRRSNEIIALRNSYHGRSSGVVGITGSEGWGDDAARAVETHGLAFGEIEGSARG